MNKCFSNMFIPGYFFSGIRNTLVQWLAPFLYDKGDIIEALSLEGINNITF